MLRLGVENDLLSFQIFFDTRSVYSYLEMVDTVFWCLLVRPCVGKFLWQHLLVTLSIYMNVPFNFHGISSLYKPMFTQAKIFLLLLTVYSRITTIFITTKHLSVVLYMNILSANNLLVTNNIKKPYCMTDFSWGTVTVHTAIKLSVMSHVATVRGKVWVGSAFKQTLCKNTDIFFSVGWETTVPLLNKLAESISEWRRKNIGKFLFHVFMFNVKAT
jgi:hypothetical protein